MDDLDRNPVLVKACSTPGWANGSSIDGAVFAISKTPTWATRHCRGMTLG
jgi:hypothetical protein